MPYIGNSKTMRMLKRGLLLRLPCKVGDIVYKVNKASKKISKHRVLKIEIEKMEGTDFTTQIWFENYDFTFAHRFGEVIFFTRDEAEAKLKKWRGKAMYCDGRCQYLNEREHKCELTGEKLTYMKQTGSISFSVHEHRGFCKGKKVERDGE